MSISTPNEPETKSKDAGPKLVLPSEPTLTETISKSAAAAKMSGTYHETTGFIKRTLGKFSDDSVLERAGRNQQLLGKVHRLVGSLRSARNAVIDKLNRTRTEGQKVCREHGGKLIDGASEFVDELKKVLLK
jgi:uncharacterized protein YjbJ (UPF0337 family)